MPNIATALKTEIARIARNELRSGTQASQKAVAAYRHQIADLKRRMHALEREVATLRKRQGVPVASEESHSIRFRPDGFAAHRKRLGLSAREVGELIGASTLSVYKWEQGKARPRAKHLESIAALRKMGKREVAQKLTELTG
jgi:DNA-binding XRE family transcriptional regulator